MGLYGYATHGNSNAANGWMPEELPNLTTYEQALTYHDNVRPYAKGAEKGNRPLGKKRRYTRSQIVAGEDYIAFTYYSNPIVKLFHDGKKHFSSCGWQSISTTHVLSETSSTPDMKFRREKGKIYVVYKSTFYRMPSFGVVEVSPDGAISGYEIESQHSINFDAMKAKRDKYAEFTKYVKDILTINQNVERHPNEEGIDSFFVSRLHAIRFMPVLKSQATGGERHVAASMQLFFELIDETMVLDEEEKFKKFYVLAQKLLASVAYDKIREALTVDETQRYFNELLKYRFASEVFTKKEVQPRDSAVHDSNKHYLYLKF
jgi:hypothetical protein